MSELIEGCFNIPIKKPKVDINNNFAERISAIENQLNIDRLNIFIGVKRFKTIYLHFVYMFIISIVLYLTNQYELHTILNIGLTMISIFSLIYFIPTTIGFFIPKQKVIYKNINHIYMSVDNMMYFSFGFDKIQLTKFYKTNSEEQTEYLLLNIILTKYNIFENEYKKESKGYGK